jgi:hypothetical protein
MWQHLLRLAAEDHKVRAYPPQRSPEAGDGLEQEPCAMHARLAQTGLAEGAKVARIEAVHRHHLPAMMGGSSAG